MNLESYKSELNIWLVKSNNLTKTLKNGCLSLKWQVKI